jgi:Abnormal spindle-like microcephaly-assoc'd, ASPM-SPD-2-Hydin
MRISPQHSHLCLVTVLSIGAFLASSSAVAKAATYADVDQGSSHSGITLSCKPGDLSYGGVATGNSKTLSVTVTNHGAIAKTISAVSRKGTSFSLGDLALPLTLHAGQSTQIKVDFAPAVAEPFEGQFKFWILGTKIPLLLRAQGTGTAVKGFVKASPASVGFGNVELGSNAQRTVTLTNPTSATVKVSAVDVTGSGFSTAGLDLPLTLAAGQSFTFSSIFAPTVAGSANGTLSVHSGTSQLAIPITGIGYSGGALSISPASLQFGNVTVGTAKTMTATLSASGGTVNVTSATLSSSEFSLSGISFPFTLAAGKSATVTLTFDPASAGSASAKISFASSASGSVAQALAGNGEAQTAYLVDLTWNASAGSIAGYNVYRGGTSGGPYSKINSALNSSTNYTDNGVAAGKTYYYVTTAVATDGVESGHSNQVQAAVP